MLFAQPTFRCVLRLICLSAIVSLAAACSMLNPPAPQATTAAPIPSPQFPPQAPSPTEPEIVIIEPSPTLMPVELTSTSESSTVVTARTPFPTGTADSNCQLLSLTPSPGESLIAGSSFFVLVSLKNTSQRTWEAHEVDLRYVNGTTMQQQSVYDLPADVPPGGAIDLTFPLTAPGYPGTYSTTWALMRGSAVCVFSVTISVL
jgi:hypothetical protein